MPGTCSGYIMTEKEQLLIRNNIWKHQNIIKKNVWKHQLACTTPNFIKRNKLANISQKIWNKLAKTRLKMWNKWIFSLLNEEYIVIL